MKVKFIVREVWFGMLGITTDTDEDYELEDVFVYPKETDLYDHYNAEIDISLVEHQKARRNNKDVIENKHSLLSLTINGLTELECSKLDKYLNDKTPTGLGVLVYKENTKILKFKFVKLDQDGQQIDDLSFDASGKFRIEKLDWDSKDHLAWFKNLFKK